MVWWELFLFFLVGALLGGLFFGGLWWTVQKIPSSRNPALLSLASFILRTAAVLGLFYLLLTADDGGWPRLLAALVGFMVTRIIIVSRIKPQRLSPASRKGGKKEAEKE